MRYTKKFIVQRQVPTWKDTFWTDLNRETAKPVSKKLAQKALKLATEMWPADVYRIEEVK